MIEQENGVDRNVTYTSKTKELKHYHLCKSKELKTTNFLRQNSKRTGGKNTREFQINRKIKASNF